MPTSLAHDDRGSLTVFTAVATLGLLVLVGLLVDGGAQLRAARQANAIAEEAARAGGSSFDASGYRAGAPARIDPVAAAAAARSYLARAGYTGTVAVSGPTSIAVTVTVREPTAILGLLGAPYWTVTGHANAHLEHGITREER